MKIRGVSLILVLMVLLTPASFAWKTVTHYDIAEAIYEKLPPPQEIQVKRQCHGRRIQRP